MKVVLILFISLLFRTAIHSKFNLNVGIVSEPQYSLTEEFKSTINTAKYESTSTLSTDLKRITRDREPLTLISKRPISGENDYTTILDKRRQTSEIFQVTKLQTSTDLSTQSSLMDPCFHVSSCSFTSNMIHQFCKCDKECQIYNDCCQGYNKETHSLSSRYFEHLSCIRGHNDMQAFEGYFAVTTCPSDYENQTVITRCYEDDIINNGPSVANESIVFKNKFCALCHQVIDYVFFRLKFSVTDKNRKYLFNVSRADKLQYLINLKYMLYTTVPPQNVSIRLCIVHSSSTNTFSCPSYINPVYHLPFRGTVMMYRNHFCVPVGPRVDCLGLLYDRIAEIGRITIYPLTVMFSFTAMTETESECSIWNEQIEEKDTCSFKETYTNLSFDVNLKLVSDKQLQAIDILHISLMYALTFDIGNLTSWKDYNMVINEENPTDVSLYTLTIKIYKTMFEEEGNNFIQMVNHLKWQLKLYDEITGDTFIVDKHSGNSSITLKKSVLNYDKLFLEANYSYAVNHMCPILKSFHEIPKRDSLCPDISITVMRKNISHLAITSFVCQLKIEKPTNRLKAVVTYACMSVSIFSLILLIIIYRKLNLSSSVPGSNLENVAVSLIFSNLLFMLGIGASDNGLVCYVIGVCLHYIWLAVFSFMSVSVCCITLTLIKIRSNGLDRKDNLTQKRCCLTFVGMIIPLFFVCPAVLLDLYGSLYLSSGYSRQPCFPNKYPANVIFFSGPSLLSIIINFICLLRIVINICKLQSEIRHVSKTNPYRYAKVYLRILVISGFFWLIGFVSSVFKNEWLEYSFIIICGLHGLFVSLASLSTRRIVRSFVEVRESKTFMVS